MLSIRFALGLALGRPTAFSPPSMLFDPDEPDGIQARPLPVPISQSLHIRLVLHVRYPVAGLVFFSFYLNLLP